MLCRFWSDLDPISFIDDDRIAGGDSHCQGTGSSPFNVITWCHHALLLHPPKHNLCYHLIISRHYVLNTTGVINRNLGIPGAMGLD